MVIAEMKDGDEGAGERPFPILALAATTERELYTLAEEISRQLADLPPHAVWSFCQQTNAAQPFGPYRLAVAGHGVDTAVGIGVALAQALAAWQQGQPSPVLTGRAATTPPPVAFLFTGHGAQSVNMGRPLYAHHPLFRHAFDTCLPYLAADLPQPLTDIVFPATPPTSEDSSPLYNGMTYSQPALFVIEYALAQLWQAWGVRPTAVIGHSVGEYAAAVLAGMISLEDGLRLVSARGRLMDALPVKGEMVAVFADPAQVASVLEPHAADIAIAVINGPSNVVISGAYAPMAAALADLKAARLRTRRLAVAQASHSPVIDPMLEEFAAIAAPMVYHPPQVAFVSGMMGEWVTAVNATYWRAHQRHTVRFSDAVQTLYAAGYDHFLEIGPDAILTGLIQRIPGLNGTDRPHTRLISLRQGEDAWNTMLTSLGTLYVQGTAVNWDQVLAYV